mmetsp:Transcript_18947/g.40892  ORF Transcript_18947/g.40892 Transcript_18947/m.40892 type:complete len:207 (+) Transcript_18947:294-914(+)
MGGSGASWQMAGCALGRSAAPGGEQTEVCCGTDPTRAPTPCMPCCASESGSSKTWLGAEGTMMACGDSVPPCGRVSMRLGVCGGFLRPVRARLPGIGVVLSSPFGLRIVSRRESRSMIAAERPASISCVWLCSSRSSLCSRWSTATLCSIDSFSRSRSCRRNSSRACTTLAWLSVSIGMLMPGVVRSLVDCWSKDGLMQHFRQTRM